MTNESDGPGIVLIMNDDIDGAEEKLKQSNSAFHKVCVGAWTAQWSLDVEAYRLACDQEITSQLIVIFLIHIAWDGSRCIRTSNFGLRTRSSA
jgi:hypothetical protein